MERDNVPMKVIQRSLNELGRIELVEVRGKRTPEYRQWNRLITNYHYLQHGKLYGRQIRYLIKSANYGILGAMSFSSAAWKLQTRDAWIGWDNDSRLKNLDRIICNSRFLILPYIKVKNLASSLLSAGMSLVKTDWENRYGISPLVVETFVEQKRFKGSCYKAANFIKIGMTTGRGRQDRNTKCELPLKDVYLYPLEKKAREILREGKPPICSTQEEPCDWAEEEFQTAELGDKRLNKRLLTIARDFYAAPLANIPQASQGRAKTRAVYRFFENEEVTMEKILAPHYEATINRIEKEKIVLAIQDTTSLNYSTHPMTEGLGPIGTDKGIIGLIVHDTLAFNLEGTPLGLLNVQCWARDEKQFGRKHNRRKYEVKDKESVKWLNSFTAAAAAKKKCPDTRIISIGDRESDVYALFKLAAENPDGAELLVRAQHNRQTADDAGYIWDLLKEKTSAGIQTLRVPRKSNIPAREAELIVRYSEYDLKAPRNGREKGSVRLWAIMAEEENPLEGVSPLKWMLLTTIPVVTFEDAIEKLDWYSKRWGIEVYHRTLKSGCKIESRQMGHADRIESCLAIDMVVAWRIYHLTKLGREIPKVPCCVFFEEAEWKTLVVYKTNNPLTPDKPPSLRDAIRMVAEIGGFLGRKGDGEPGTQTIWRGLQALDNMIIMWKIFAEKARPPTNASP